MDQEIKTTLFAGEEVEPLISAKLNEAVEAQALAEIFVPVANTDNAREAAEVVKEAVGNATKGLERVKEASNILKKVIERKDSLGCIPNLMTYLNFTVNFFVDVSCVSVTFV